jgi:hypothetical protein
MAKHRSRPRLPSAAAEETEIFINPSALKLNRRIMKGGGGFYAAIEMFYGAFRAFRGEEHWKMSLSVAN